MTKIESIIGKEIKLVKMNECRFDELEQPMLHQDYIIADNINRIFTICDYDPESNLYAIYARGEKIWIYRNEFKVLIRNM